MSSPNNQVIYPIEKIVSVLSYYTFGLVGLLYLIIALIKKQGLRSFIRYHVFMSIFISITIYIVSIVLMFVIDILGFIPFLRPFLFSLVVLCQTAIISFLGAKISITTIAVYGLLTYLAGGALLGKYTYLPWVSNVINYNLHR